MIKQMMPIAFANAQQLANFLMVAYHPDGLTSDHLGLCVSFLCATHGYGGSVEPLCVLDREQNTKDENTHKDENLLEF